MRILLLALFSIGTVVSALPGRSGGDDSPASDRFHTTRTSRVVLPLPEEDDAFVFAVFGDRTGGPAQGVQVLAEAVEEANLLGPDLVMTVGDLVEGYNQTEVWLNQMHEFKGIMAGLRMPWFPVAGNHDVYWRGPNRPPREHEQNFEEHFGPLWYAFEHKNCWFIALFSDEGDPETGEKTFGKPECQRMSPEQFEFLRGALERAQVADHVFLFLHHPRWLGGNYGDGWNEVHELLAAAGNVTAVFAGHIHRMRYDGVRDGIEYFTLATTGGGQSGDIPEAGYLHQYHLVTVRPTGISLATYPVGSALDPRAITGAISTQARLAANQVVPRFAEGVAFSADQSAGGMLSVSFANTAALPVEVRLVPDSRDPRWKFQPDHLHRVLSPTESASFRFEIQRAAGCLDDVYADPELSVQRDLLTETHRVALPEHRQAIPLVTGALLPPEEPAVEQALALDGARACLSVASAALDLGPGPFTVEALLRADSFRKRQGFLNKTETSGFGIFLPGGRPEFLVHAGGAYCRAIAPEPLAAGVWHHVAGVYDGAELRLYANGRLVASAPAEGPRKGNDLPLYIGADVDRSGRGVEHFQGQIDEVRISRVARYSGEEPFTPERRLAPDGDTLLLLHMDQRLGPWLFDSSPRATHARAEGDAWTVPAAD